MPGIKGEYIYDDKGNIIGATGGLKTAMTNKQKYGSEWYKKIGSNGGKAKVPKGFGKNESLASRAGRKAGTISKTGHKFIEIKDGYRYYVALDTGKVVKYKHEDKYKG